MQVKLWKANESGLKSISRELDYAMLKISVAKIANLAIAQYIVTRDDLKKKKSK